MHQLDGSFRRQKADARARSLRRRRRRLWTAAALLFVAGGLGASAYYAADHVYYPMDAELTASPEMLEAEEKAAASLAVPYVPAIVNLAGDPLLITFDAGAGSRPAVHLAETPETLKADGVAPSLGILSDVMLSSSERFMTALPSSPEDFAFFQAQRDAPPPAVATGAAAADAASVAAGAEERLPDQGVADEPGAGWGETIDEGRAALPAFARTPIENTTSVTSTVSESRRFRPTEDLFVRVLDEKDLAGVLSDNGYLADEAAKAGAAARSVFALGALPAGAIVAMRGAREGGTATSLGLVQVSVYAADRYLGSLALGDDGGFVKAADPWVGEDLTRHFRTETAAAPTQRYRLIDAIYSTAARNGVPSGVIGEIIMHLSRSHDLNAFADFAQRLVLVYSETPRDTDRQDGRVLFVAVRGGGDDLECFVYRPRPGAPFGCLSDLSDVQQLTVRDGMVVPVNGVMTSTFGPRRHPILDTVRLHKGVDWAAPVGTPVVAAFAGTIASSGDGEDYGKLVAIDHADGRQTLYAHLSRFADGLHAGQEVAADETIGYVGSSGLSTGPHLHFELHSAGVAIDPLGTAASAVAEADDDGGAVDLLVDKIVHVESGGRADAKNPLSTATGLGQFIDATWIRMMTTYRPDLGRTLPRADLLTLRGDPTLSREMVRNLARENEASLRAAGHAVTAGRLYLAHFLGPDGANLVLAAEPDADLSVLLGDGVIRANPFLAGETAGYVVNWAERKMSGRGGPAAPVVERREVARPSPEFEAYRKAVLALVESAAEAL